MKNIRNILLVMTVCLFSISGYAKSRGTAGKKLCFNSIKKCQSHLALATKLTELNRKIRVSGQCERVMESGCKVSLETNFNLKYYVTADQKAHTSWKVKWSGDGMTNRYFDYVNVKATPKSVQASSKACNKMLNAVRSFNTRKLLINGNCEYTDGQYIQYRFFAPHISGEFEVKIKK